MQLTKLSSNKIPFVVLAITALVGLVDAGYLTYQHYSGSGLICNISHGCEKVLNSAYAVIFGVPVALLGMVFYFMILLMAVYFYTNKPHPKLLLAVGTIGFLSTIYLFILQAFVIKAWCQYCLLSALTSTIIFIISAIVYKQSYKKREENDSKA